MREEGTAETDFEFQLFERAPDQGTREILQTVGHKKHLFEVFNALERNKSDAKHVLGSEEEGVGEGPVEAEVGRHSRTWDMI
jgi:hypothetical protein